MSWYAVTETCLAFTVFREDFSPRFVGLFTLLLFLKCFHWLAEDRVDFVSILFIVIFQSWNVLSEKIFMMAFGLITQYSSRSALITIESLI